MIVTQYIAIIYVWYMHISFLCKNDKPKFYTSIESLFNQLLEADCESVLSMLSITHHEKYTRLFNAPKYPIENVWKKSTGCDSLKTF